MNDTFETMQQIQWAADCNAANYMRTGAAGSFAAALADAYFAADSRNKDRLLAAFRDVFDRFVNAA